MQNVRALEPLAGLSWEQREAVVQETLADTQCEQELGSYPSLVGTLERVLDRCLSPQFRLKLKRE